MQVEADQPVDEGMSYSITLMLDIVNKYRLQAQVGITKKFLLYYTYILHNVNNTYQIGLVAASRHGKSTQSTS